MQYKLIAQGPRWQILEHEDRLEWKGPPWYKLNEFELERARKVLKTYGERAALLIKKLRDTLH